ALLILTDPAVDRLLGFAQGHERLRGIVNAELPPLVAPFRGERFASRDRLGALVAPPYDVISKEERARYAAQDPHNIVHLILPEAAGGDRYAHAAAQLAAWRDAGVLRADPADSVYLVAQDYPLPSGARPRPGPSSTAWGCACGWCPGTKPRSCPASREAPSCISPTAITATRRRSPTRRRRPAPTAYSPSSCRREIPASRSSPLIGSSLAPGGTPPSCSRGGAAGSTWDGSRPAWTGSNGSPGWDGRGR